MVTVVVTINPVQHVFCRSQLLYSSTQAQKGFFHLTDSIFALEDLGGLCFPLLAVLNRNKTTLFSLESVSAEHFALAQ